MIIFLHGDDTFRSREKLRELKEKFLREVDPSGTNLTVLDGTTVSASEVWGAVAAQSFLVRKRMVIVEDLGQQKSTAAREEVTGFLEKIPEDAIVVFWESKNISPPPKGRGSNSSFRSPRGAKEERGRDGKKRRGGPMAIGPPAGSDPLFPALLKRADHTQEFIPLDGVALTRWVQDRAKALGATMDPAATRELIAIVGSDLWRMSNELEKLALAAGMMAPDQLVTRHSSLVTISSALIRDLVDAAPQDHLFAFVDAVGHGDRAAAIRCLRELEAARVDPHHLLAMLHRQLRLLVMAADLLDRGTPASQLAVELHVHPFVAQKLSQQVRTSSLSALRALYPHLLELDRKLKSSRAPWQALMELFILDAAHT